MRARIAADKTNLRAFAKAAGFRSHNYVAMRNRDEKPYDLDDLALICRHYDENPHDFVLQAYERHADSVLAEMMRARDELEDGLSAAGRREVAKARQEMEEAERGVDA